MLTSPEPPSPAAPVVAGERTLRALVAIRKDRLLPLLYPCIVIARSVAARLTDVLPTLPDWLLPADDPPAHPGAAVLPARVANADPSDAATLRLALAIPASIVLLDGPIKERAKLSYIKAEGAVSILVQAHRMGHLSAVKPMVSALRTLGYADVLPPPEALEALWRALDNLEDA